MTDNTQELDEILSTFIALKFDVDTDDFSGGTLERYNNCKQAIQSLIRTEKLKLLNEVIYQSTVNLKSAKAVAGWAELRKEQLEAEL